MFLSQLTKEQQNSYLALVTKVVMADGDVTPEEEQLLHFVRVEMGGTAKAPTEEIFGPISVGHFPDRKSRVIVMLELMLMGHVDRRFHVDEEQVVEQIAAEFGFGDVEMATMQDWAIRTATLVREASHLMLE